MLNNLCDQHDWDILAAKDNQEALELSQSRPFDLIIASGRTSSQQDIDLLRRLCLVRPHTRLIILTDEFTPGDVLGSIRERAFSHFARPSILGVVDRPESHYDLRKSRRPNQLWSPKPESR